MTRHQGAPSLIEILAPGHSNRPAQPPSRRLPREHELAADSVRRLRDEAMEMVELAVES